MSKRQFDDFTPSIKGKKGKNYHLMRIKCFFFLYKQDGYTLLDIPSIDPYHVDLIHLKVSPLFLKAAIEARDIDIRGATNLRIKNVRSKINNKNVYFEGNVLLPLIDAQGYYSGHITLGDVPIKPKGQFDAKLCEYIFYLDRSTSLSKQKHFFSQTEYQHYVN